MFSLGMGANTAVFASAGSYLAAHVFAYLQTAKHIPVPASAREALEHAANEVSLKGFLSLQEASAVEYFLETPPKSNPDPIPLATDPDGMRRYHDLDSDQIERVVSHLQEGAIELKGSAESWLKVAALEIEHAEYSAQDPLDDAHETSRKLGIGFGQCGMRQKALSIFLNEVLTSKAFRPSAPDELEISLSRIELIIRVTGDMANAGLPAKHTANMFDQASALLDEVMTHVEKQGLASEQKRQIWYDLKHLIQKLPDNEKKDILDTKLLQLV